MIKVREEESGGRKDAADEREGLKGGKESRRKRRGEKMRGWGERTREKVGGVGAREEEEGLKRGKFAADRKKRLKDGEE